MWRFISLASLIIAAGVMMWPARTTRNAASPILAQDGESDVIEVIHYGGNLICHERRGNKLVGSGNNIIGRLRTEAMNSKRGVVVQQQHELEVPR